MPVRERMVRLLERLGYDFDGFTLDRFVDWISHQRGRDLVLVGRPLPPNLYGAWIQTADTDYIFYDENAAPVHRLHIQLHELAHLLCEHENHLLSDEQAASLFTQNTDQLASTGYLRSPHTDDAEREAETLAGLIYEQISHHQRLGRLTSSDASRPTVASYWRLLE